MALRLEEHNLYASGEITVFEEGNQILERTPLELDTTQEGQYHVLRRGEDLDALAYRYYGDLVERPSRWWWAIADANNILNPLDLDALVGQELVIPDIETVRIRR